MPRLGNAVPFTGHAMRALKLSIAFSQTFRGPERVPLAHALDLDTPPGTSTGGGENVTQTVKLTVGKMTPIAIATVNAAAGKGDVSTYGAAVAAFASANAGAPFPFDQAQYAMLEGRLAAFFAKEKIAIGSAEAATAELPSGRDDAKPIARSRTILLVLVAAIVIGAAAAVVLGLR